ncbi:hypothetical protein HanXRQr2_Chr10g0438431 [Helianthus annuus]|uniref:Uncharacterized protein n=1 Tax=Helianthus annuus TaxID=4232 RepID=A0A9K3HX98_HELAN|nr:hypothetical protein HanXRQr2_Chr10g0438431 [Helianthus annuus]
MEENNELIAMEDFGNFKQPSHRERALGFLIFTKRMKLKSVHVNIHNSPYWARTGPWRNWARRNTSVSSSRLTKQTFVSSSCSWRINFCFAE